MPLAAAYAQAPAVAPAAPTGSTLDAVVARGYLNCGVSGGSFGFSLPDSQGEMRGIDADECRAVAAAVFGQASAVKFVKVAPQQRLTALQSGEIDLLFANLTWTMSRETRQGVQFTGIHFYDGVSVIVKKTSKAKNLKMLAGASICTLPGGSSDINLQDYMRKNKIKFKPVVISEVEEVKKAFIAGRCDAWVHDASALASFRAAQGDKASNYVILPDLLSNEPLGGAVRKGDGRWYDIARWTHLALVLAEQYGVTSENADQMVNSDSPDVRRLLGLEGELGKSMGLSNQWALNAIKGVGNFGQMWSRNIVPLGIPRGYNRLWNDGGLQYAPPMR
jgi:general L-amino acid transport system substrate-binding protein